MTISTSKHPVYDLEVTTVTLDATFGKSAGNWHMYGKAQTDLFVKLVSSGMSGRDAIIQCNFI